MISIPNLALYPPKLQKIAPNLCPRDMDFSSTRHVAWVRAASAWTSRSPALCRARLRPRSPTLACTRLHPRSPALAPHQCALARPRTRSLSLVSPKPSYARHLVSPCILHLSPLHSVATSPWSAATTIFHHTGASALQPQFLSGLHESPGTTPSSVPSPCSRQFLENTAVHPCT